MANLLTEHQAFVAMQTFLRAFADRTGGGHFPTLLSDIAFDEDGGTHDPAAWADWLHCVADTVSQGG
jgi:hypothetical protein